MTYTALIPGKAYDIAALVPLEIHLIETPIMCGFPSPAQDYIQKPIDLNDVLIKNKTATFLFIAEGHSMIGEHIPDGSLLVIDRSISPKNGHIILADVDGEFTLKKLDMQLMRLMPANPAFEPIVMKEGMELKVCGVVTHIIINPYLSYVRSVRL